PRLDADFLVADSKFMKVAFGVGFKMIVVPSSGIVTTSRYVVPTGRVKVPAGRYVVPTGKDNVIVSTGRTKVIPAGRTILVLIEVDKTLRFVEEPVKNSGCKVMRFLTSLLNDGRGSGSWMFLFVWSGYAAMRTLLWAGKVASSKISCES
ncbi:hypothetical protein Tco_0517443, partial [Tanacetum coccineum]